MQLEGKVAIVTGAARGIGRAIAERYAREGAQEVATGIGRNAVGVGFDVTHQDSIDALVARTVAELGSVDILVNNAGIFTLAPIVEISREDYRKVFAINVEGLLFTRRGEAARSSTSPRRPAAAASRWWRSTAPRRPPSSA